MPQPPYRSKHSRRHVPPDLEEVSASLQHDRDRDRATGHPLPLRRGAGPAVSPRTAVSAFLEHCRARATPLAEKTISNYALVLSLLCAWLEERRGVTDVWNVSADDLHAWFYELRTLPSARTGKPLSLYSVQSYATHVAACWRWLVDEDWAPAHVMTRLRVPRVPVNLREPPRTFADEDIARLMDACVEGDGPAEMAALTLRNQALLAILLDTGVREGELVSMRAEQINWEQRSLQVILSKTKRRTVDIGGERAPALLRRYTQRSRPYLAAIRPQDSEGEARGPLWLSRDGYPLSERAVRQFFQRLRHRTGLPEGMCKAHLCRRYYITRAIQGGIPLPDIARQCGVSVEVIYRHYYAATEQEFLARVQAGSPMDRLERQRRGERDRAGGGRRRREGDILGD